MTYSYETYPGQTIVRTHPEGYSKEELLEELSDKCDGVIVTDPDREDSFTLSLSGISLRNCRLQFTDHGCGSKSVQAFKDGLILDLNL